MDTRETKVYLAILIAAAVIGIILIYFIVNNIRQQRRNYAFYLSKIKAEITTLEKERHRMARDLHDEVAPLLNAVKYNLSSFEFDDPADSQVMGNSENMLDTIINRMREISADLMPESLIRNGLVDAIHQSITKEHAKTKLDILFTHSRVPSMDPEKTVNIYRIIQEILSNTIRHAAAKRLAIDIQSDGKTLILLTEDDGLGFDYPAEEKEFSGLGLRNLLSRTDMLNGAMYLETKPGAGTRYRFEIPV